MPTLLRAAVRYLRYAPVLMLAGCAVPAGAPAPASVQDVRSVEIHYHYSGWSRADEVHRLQHGAGQRTFTRTSMVETAAGVETTQARVPAQRVGELMWALSAPPWPRERAVQVVARRVRPAAMLEQAPMPTDEGATGCTPDELRGRMYAQLQGAALRTQLDTYYQRALWTDDEPSMRVVIRFSHAPDRVISSNSQKLLMLPWTLGDLSAPVSAAPPVSWSVPVSDAVRRLLPVDSQAAQRLGDDTSSQLAATIGQVARQGCEAGAVR